MDISFKRYGNTWVGSDGTWLPVIAGGDGSTEAFTTGVVEGDPAAVTNGFVLDAGDGVITGAQPGARPGPAVRAPEYVQQADPTFTRTGTGTVTATGTLFTAEDVERILKEEKDKLYADLQETKNSLKEMEKRDKQRAKDEADAKAAADDEQRLKDEAEMELRQLLDKRETEWNARFEAERAERERMAATLDMERQYVALTQYRTQRIDAERQNILPEMIDLVGGNTQEEIEASIDSLRKRSTSILENMNAAANAARQQMQGTSVTAPPVGPTDTQSQQQTLTPEEIRAMDINQYAQHRDRLLGAARQHTRENGIYG